MIARVSVGSVCIWLIPLSLRGVRLRRTTWQSHYCMTDVTAWIRTEHYEILRYSQNDAKRMARNDTTN
ncbi:MAG: hypothetical protein V1932_08355 [Chloroflexota bacterium]